MSITPERFKKAMADLNENMGLEPPLSTELKNKDKNVRIIRLLTNDGQGPEADDDLKPDTFLVLKELGFMNEKPTEKKRVKVDTRSTEGKPVEKEKKEKKASGPKTEKTLWGHVKGKQSGVIDELILSGTKYKDIVAKIAEMGGKDKEWAEARVSSHIKHLIVEQGRKQELEKLKFDWNQPEKKAATAEK